MLALPASPFGLTGRPALSSIAMRKFVLIDHSLRDVGGHHYAYAREFLAAARRAGFEAVLATNRRFRQRGAFADAATVLPLFRNESYTPLSFDMQAFRPGVQRAIRRPGLGALWRSYRRARLARAFAQDCRSLFDRVRLSSGDQVFLATASEIDLTGLSAFLRAGRALPQVDWHVQFHFGIFQGRDPDYEAQSAAEAALRGIFHAAFTGLEALNVHCYCTTEPLSAQYRRLGVAPFETLPYPVNADLRTGPPSAPPAAPVRIACLGHARREKGLNALSAVIDGLWDGYLRDGHAQLLVQTHRRRARRELNARVAQRGAQGATPPLVFAPFPLDLAGYTALVRSAGIGLLLYDSARYYARCSGVLLELLCAGVPVIVPAGCWLSEQITEANQSHLDALAAGAQGIAAHYTRDGPPEGQTLQCSRESAEFETRVDAPRSLLLVRYRITAGAGPGRYLRWELSQRDAGGAALAAPALDSTVVGPRAAGFTAAAFAIDPRARSLRLRVCNAWHDQPTTIGPIECLARSGPASPLAAVGLAVHEAAQAPAALDEILRHYAHYRRGAA
ncbi:MAG TPA: hypothetical protein VN859_01065, partial [Steroidobacteraceae bacterium]|nr:hypothetical protein [Steroidobacteraceae bacterium]